jgi:hypothetical protein
VIECFLIDLIREVGRTMVPFDLVTLVWPHSRWKWQAIIFSSLVATTLFYQAMEVSCYHSFWAVKSRLCLHLLTLGSFTCKYLQVFSLSAQDVEFVRIDLLVSIAKLLKDPSRLSNCHSEQSIWSSRLLQEMQRRSSRWAHTFSCDSISSNNVIVWRTCCFHR